MTPQERKAVRAMVRQGSDLYAAAKGSAPIFENRDHMREAISQFVEEHMALLDSPGVLAEWLLLANEGRGEVEP
jgi:hypothetical protein